MISAILFISLFIFMILQAPVGIAIGLSSLTSVFLNSRLSEGFMMQQLCSGSDSFPLMAIPLFILAGELMADGGVSEKILEVASAFFGRITGGLAIVTIVVCMFFAAVSGSGPATVAAVGSMVVPTMLQKGYSKSFTLACVACGGCIGVIIPPSIPMVIYGVSTSTSVSSMFLAGFAPGIFIGERTLEYDDVAAFRVVLFIRLTIHDHVVVFMESIFHRSLLYDGRSDEVEHHARKKDGDQYVNDQAFQETARAPV